MVCARGDLQGAAAACASGIAASAQCAAFLQTEQMQHPACAACLAPFEWDFNQVAGLVACAAPYLDPTCGGQAQCYADCLDTSCMGCSTNAMQSQCLTSVASAACSTYTAGGTCLSAALAGSAAVCNPSTYQGSFGAWFAAVGATYCGM
jgi:hypothetical protein